MDAPNEDLALKTLPKPLLKAIRHIFAQEVSDCALVGGTCLAGFYAGHRSSDDIDLFAKSEIAFRAAVRAVKNLASIGAELSNEALSKQFYRTSCRLGNHPFTIDVVVDENLFAVGKFTKLKSGVVVATLETLLKMKAATLVSRCGEKDLYDLLWLFGQFKGVSIADLIRFGSEVDKGTNSENILASLIGTNLREEACGFAMGRTATEVLADVTALRKKLILEFEKYLKNQPVPKLGQLVKRVKKVLE